MAQAESISSYRPNNDKRPRISGEMPPTPPLPEDYNKNFTLSPSESIHIPSTPEYPINRQDPLALIDQQYKDLYKNKDTLEPEKFTAQLKLLEAQETLIEARVNKKPLKISADKLLVLKDSIICQDLSIGERLRQLNEIDELLVVPEKKQLIKSESVRSIMREVAENGEIKIISPKQYDDFIQDISASTENSDDFIKTIEELDKLVYVVDLEEVDETGIEKRFAKQAEDIIVQSMINNEKLSVSKEQAEAAKNQWFSKYNKSNPKKFNQRLRDLYHYTNVEGAPVPPPLPKPKETINVLDSDTLNLEGDKLEEIAEAKAQSLSNDTEIKFQTEKEDEQQTDYVKQRAKLIKKVDSMLAMSMEKFRQEGLEKAKILAKQSTLKYLMNFLKENNVQGKRESFDYEHAINYRIKMLKHNVWQNIELGLSTPDNTEKLGFNLEDFKKYEKSFKNNLDFFKKQYKIHPEDLGYITRARFKNGLAITKKDRTMCKAFNDYQSAKNTYLDKISRIIKHTPDLINKNKAYKELSEAGVNI